MACVYKYKGATLSERQLDDFLLGYGKEFLDKYGDEVFSTTLPEQREIFNELKQIATKGAEIRKKHIIAKTTYDDSDILNFDVKDFKPVTHFLEGLKNINDLLLFPEFIADNYFNERRKDWENGKFTVKEMNLLFPDGNLPESFDENSFDFYRLQIQEMWDTQGKIGTELHKVMQYYFSGEKGSQHRVYSDEVLFTAIRNRTDPELLTDDHVKQTIQYCRDLENALKKTYNSNNLIYFPELVVTGEIIDPETKNVENLLGMIDLLVLDDRGNTHIIDFKTSPQDYNIEVPVGQEVPINAYSPAKKLAFGYQLNVYNKLLLSLGLTPVTTDVNVAPLLLSNFRKEGDNWVFDQVKPWEGYIDNLTLQATRDATINENLAGLFKESYLIDAHAGNILSNVEKTMEALFKIHDKKITTKSPYVTKYSYDDVREFMGDKVVELNNGDFEFAIDNRVITAHTKDALLEKVYNIINRMPLHTAENVNRIKIAIQNRSLDSFKPSTKLYDENANTHWILDILDLYVNGHYVVVKTPKLFDELGIIVLENTITNNFEILKISNNLVKTNLKANGRKNLTAKFENDIVENSKSDSLMLLNTYGNIDLIEALVAINQIPNMFAHKGTIKNILVINPVTNQGLTASNKELLYSFKKLAEHLDKTENKLEHNYISDGTIKFQNLASSFLDSLHTIIATIDSPTKKWNKFVECITGFDALILDPEQMSSKLEDLRIQMEETWPELKTSDISEIRSLEEKTYFELLKALAEVQGYNYRQQIKDSENWVDGYDLRKGHKGLMLDNPGVTSSLNLNMITQVVTLAYLNVRSNMTKAVSEVRRLNEALKKEKAFTYLKERTYGNKVNLYKNMYYRTSDGDWLFRNPDELQGAERDFLEYTLATINANRYQNKTLELLINMRNTNNRDYYRVPLAAGGSVLQVSGLLKAAKHTLQGLLPSEIKLRFKDKINNLMSDSSEQEKNILRGALWEMTTLFDGGESNRRLSLLNNPKRMEGYYEHDLETLLLKHIYAYSLKTEIDKVFPLIKATAIHLLFSGISLNTKYTNCIEYLQNYVKSAIFNKPLIKDRDIVILEYANKLMKSTSIQALGLAPRLLYQAVEGLWKDIGLLIRKPYGPDSFKFKDMRDSFFNTFLELKHFGNKRSKLELINELYALNDMDMNVYAQHLVDGHNLFHNFSTFLFRMASRPDFYNRLTIFQAQMRGDGCWDAHSVVNGRLKYDWTKDKRFDVLAKGLKNDPKYKALEMLYLEIAKQMVVEKTKNEDGTLFQIKDADGNYNPLPKAYTVLQSESYKALSDSIYGYYSHEKRSLLLATLIGGLFMQMYTYWSGKKNLFLAPGSVKNQGLYVHVEVDGKKQYYQLKSDGNVDFNAPFTENNTGAPVIQWRGNFSEGIITTLANMGADLYNGLQNGQTVKTVWNSYWNNENDNLKIAYRQNLSQLMWDSFVFAAIGGVIGASMLNAAQEYVGQNKDTDDINLVLINTNMLLASNIFKASTLDFNAAESIFGRGMSWTPFSFSMYENTIKNWSYVFGGKRSFRDGVINSFSATRQTKPLWQKLFPDETEN